MSKPQPFTMTMHEYSVRSNSGEGFCVKCRSEAFGCEPDMRRGLCESCDKPGVFGLEELLMMNLIEITD